MKQVSTSENAAPGVTRDINDSYQQGYQRALLDVRAGLCFDGGENAFLDVVLNLLDKQNRNIQPVQH